MKCLKTVTFEEVISRWAEREQATPVALLQSRQPLLQTLPSDTKWLRVRIAKEDVPSLRLINEQASWNILSDSTGRLDTAATNFLKLSENPPRLPCVRLANGVTLQGYFDHLMESLRKFRSSAGMPGHDLTLILIGSSQEGPFTILEGNHTVMGLYFRYYLDHPELQYPAHESYLGTSALMYRCPWHYSI